MPFGPQYSIEFGNTSMSMNGLQVWPAPNLPSSPQACRRRNVVWPASTPVPNSSNSKIVRSSPACVGVKLLTPSRLCRTPANQLPSGANSSSNEGSFVGLTTSNQSGWFWFAWYPMSSIAKPLMSTRVPPCSCANAAAATAAITAAKVALRCQVADDICVHTSLKLPCSGPSHSRWGYLGGTIGPSDHDFVVVPKELMRNA